MAQLIGRLTALKVARLSEPGLYADGGGLYRLEVLASCPRPAPA